MGSISVSLKVLEEREEALTRMSRRVGSIESEFVAIRNALDCDVRNENGIDRDMQKILDRLRGIEAGLRNAGVFLQDTKKAYETAEEKLKQSYSRIGEGYKYRVVINTNIWDKLLENEKVREYLWNSGKQIVLGNFTDEVTLLGTAGQIVLGFTGLDVVGDIRDLTADIVKWKWSWSHVGQTLIDIVALVPVIGLVKYGDEAVEVIKSGLKNGGKLLEEGSKIAAKYWDEVSKVIEKHWEEACAVIRKNGEELIKALKKYGEEVAEAVSGKWNELIERINSYWGEAMKNLEKFRDEFAETFKNCWEQVAASGSKATDEIIETVSGKWDEFAGSVKQTWGKASEQGTKLLDEAMGIVGKEKDEIAKLVTGSWNDTCEAVGKYWDNVTATLGGYWKGALKLRSITNSSEELLEAGVKYGDEVVEAVAKGSDKGVSSLIFNNKSEYFDYINDIGKKTDMSVEERFEKIKEAYNALSDKTDVNCPIDPKYVKGFDDSGRILYDWPDKMGFDHDSIIPITKENPLPDKWDRYGSLGGDNFSSVPDNGIKYTYDQRSIPYTENPQAYHYGAFDNDSYFDIIDAIKSKNITILNNILKGNGCDMLSKIEFKDICSSYQDFIEKAKIQMGDIDVTYGLMGRAAPWKYNGEIVMNGGAEQIITPFNGEMLEKLGILLETK